MKKRIIEIKHKKEYINGVLVHERYFVSCVDPESWVPNSIYLTPEEFVDLKIELAKFKE